MDIVASKGVHFEHGIHFIHTHTHAPTHPLTHNIIFILCHIYQRCHCCSQIVILRTECPLMYLTVLVKIKTNKQQIQ